MWNIKKYVSKGDYVYAVVPEHPKASRYGYVLLHRVIVENSIERLLLDKEEVHHLDGNRKNNSIENLQVMMRGEHQSLHMRLRYPQGRAKVIVTCANCGIEFTRWTNNTAKAKGQRQDFCSRPCSGKYNGFKRR